MKRIILLIASVVFSTQCLAIESLSGMAHNTPIDNLANALKNSLRADNKPNKDIIKKQGDDIIMVYGGEDLKPNIQPSTLKTS